MNINSKIIIVGTGPVGLITTWMLWEVGYHNITIIDKRKEYTRKQILVIDKEQYEIFIPKKVSNILKKKGCFVSYPRTNQNAYCYNNPKMYGDFLTLEINVLEKELLKYIKKNTKVKIYRGISNLILNECYIEFRYKYKQYKDEYNIIIGADGHDSKIRNKYLGGVKKINKTHAGVFYFKFDKNDKQHSDRFEEEFKNDNTHIYNNILKTNNRVRAFRQRDGSFVISLQLAPEEYKYLNKYKNIDKMKNILELVLKNAGYTDSYENIMKNNFKKYDSFEIDIFKAKKYAKIVNKKCIALIVGDAVFGLHFFSASGLRSGIESALLAVMELKNKINDKKDFIKIYNRYLNEEVNLKIYFASQFIYDYKLINKRCKQFTKKELISKLSKFSKKKQEYLKKLTKKEICYLESYSFDVHSQDTFIGIFNDIFNIYGSSNTNELSKEFGQLYTNYNNYII